MGKELSEHLVRMYPVTAIDRSVKEQNTIRLMVTGGESVFFKTIVNSDWDAEQVELLRVPWQDGTVDFEGGGANGVTCEAMLEAVIGRLRSYQETDFKCRENALAITAAEEARNWLTMRREDRFKRGVLNKHEI